MSRNIPSHNNVTIAPVARHNVRSVCELKLAEDQADSVAPAAYTVAEAHYEPAVLLRAIYLGDQPAGVALIDLESRVPRLVRFMIAESYQRRGIGKDAFKLILAELRSQGFGSLEVTCHPGNTDAVGFWTRCGLNEAGETEHGELLLVKRI